MQTTSGIPHTKRRSFVAVVVAGLIVGAGCSPTSTGIRSAASSRAAVVAAEPGTIVSEGPLSRIRTSPTLDCSVNHVGDADPEFYAGTACMTAAFARIPDVVQNLTTPSDVPSWSDLFTADNIFLPSSQSGPTGSGTAADPFQVVTTAFAIAAVFTQTDSYVVGQESYRTDIEIRSVSDFGTTEVTLYRAADCQLQDSDYGFGSYDALTGSIACRGVADPTADPPTMGDRRIQWTPITPGSHYFEGSAYELWQAVDKREPFPDSCRCGTTVADYVDNAAGLSWQMTLQPMQTTTVSFLTTFSPTGSQPLVTTKSADAPTARAGGTSGYTINLHNPNPEPKRVSSISDDLPDGFSYRPGTSSGATTSDPEVSDSRLTWAGPVTVPPGGDITLHFGVNVSRSPGPYTNDASADAGSIGVVPAIDAAPMEVTGVPDDPPVVDAGDNVRGKEGAGIIVSGSVVDTDSPAVNHRWSATAGPDVDAGASCTPADATALTTTFVCTDDGTWTFTLTADDGMNAPVADAIRADVTNVAPVVVAPPTASASPGTPLTLEVNVADPGANDTVQCTFSWDDGSTTSVGFDGAGHCTASHSYATAGTFQARITGTDDDGDTSQTATTVVTVASSQNQPPIVDAGDPIVVAEGSSFTTHATVTDPDGPTLTTSWTVTADPGNDAGAVCTTTGSGPIDLTGSCSDDGGFTLRFSADDGANSAVADTLRLTVTNAAPLVGSTGVTPPAPRVGSPTSVTATITDAGTNDTLSCTIAWGDGAVGAGTFTPNPGFTSAGTCSGTHTYTTGGARIIELVALDDDGGVGSATIPLTVTAPPEVDAGEAVSGAEGSPIELAGSVTAGVTSTWTFTPGAGTDTGAACIAAAPTNATTTVTCNDDGVWTATLTAPEGVGGSVTDTTSVTVTNVAPAVGPLMLPSTAAVGASAHVVASVFDVGTNDTLGCNVSWGDGMTSAGVIAAGQCGADHIFTAAGVRTVTMTVTDDDGGSNSSMGSVTVQSTPATSLTITFRGDLTYRNSGPVISGGFTVKRDGFGVQAITGTGAIAGTVGPTLTVSFNLQRVFIFPLWVGTIRWRDGTFVGTTPVITTDIGRMGTDTKGRTNGVTFDGRLRIFDLQWTISS